MQDGPDSSAPAERRAVRWRSTLPVLVVVTALLGGVSLGLNRLAVGGIAQPGAVAAPSGSAGPAGRMFACAFDSSTAQDRASGELGCQRQALDYGRRPQLSPAQLSEAKPLMRQVDFAVETAVRDCLSAAADSCVAVPAQTRVVLTSAAPGGMVVAETPPVVATLLALAPIHAALRRAGLAAAVVRMARADDPAPPGSVVYAVSAGPVCVVGYHGQHQAAARALGRLPSGSCLTP